MKDYKEANIAVDLHNKHSMIGYRNEKGKYCGQQQVDTSPVKLSNRIVGIPADYKRLTIEQSNLAFFYAEKLSDYVDELIVCDPRENKLLTRSSNKNDALDTFRLCRLLRLDELKAVWRPKQMGKGRLFYGQAKQYPAAQ